MQSIDEGGLSERAIARARELDTQTQYFSLQLSEREWLRSGLKLRVGHSIIFRSRILVRDQILDSRSPQA
jgi:hypothetical protein